MKNIIILLTICTILGTAGKIEYDIIKKENFKDECLSENKSHILFLYKKDNDTIVYKISNKNIYIDCLLKRDRKVSFLDETNTFEVKGVWYEGILYLPRKWKTNDVSNKCKYFQNINLKNTISFFSCYYSEKDLNKEIPSFIGWSFIIFSKATENETLNYEFIN